MAQRLVELSFEELENKITGTLAERYAREILSGVTSYGKGDDVFALRGSRSAGEVRQRIAGGIVTRAAPSSAPVASALASLLAPTAIRSIASAAPVLAPSVLSAPTRKGSAILTNAEARARAARGQASGSSILAGADAFAARQRAVREQRERASQADPKGAA